MTMKVYFKNKEELVAYVDDKLTSLGTGSVLTMTIVPGQFADFSASIAIDTWSANTAETKELNSFSQRMNISHKSTQVG